MGSPSTSPGFCSHQGGYELCIAVDANSWGEAEGTRVSVWVRVRTMTTSCDPSEGQ